VTQALLSQTLVDEEGDFVESTVRALKLYEEEVEIHKMNVSFLRAGKENYSLFLTASET
jgi:hypothetical protein